MPGAAHHPAASARPAATIGHRPANARHPAGAPPVRAAQTRPPPKERRMTAEPAVPIVWLRDWDEAFARARQERKPVLVDVEKEH